MTVRERLNALTTKLWDSIDVTLDSTDPDPDADSISYMNSAIADTVSSISSLVDPPDEPLTAINNSISAITAIPANQRTDAQKDKLELLRIVKAQHLVNVDQYRSILNLQRRVKTLQRNHTIIARFAMMLDGGPNRVRESDVNGSE